MTIFDDIRKDREAGSPGNWVKSVDGSGFVFLSSEETFKPVCEVGPEGEPGVGEDTDRIARVPQLEAIALAAEKLERIFIKILDSHDIGVLEAEEAIEAFRKSCND